MKNKTLKAADLFCGAGGFSSALMLACQEQNIELDLLAVNHWDIAIATHQLNHPGIKHLQADLDGINPRKVIACGRLDLLIASPECTHHSRARGGRPMNDQSRATAFCVLRWAEALDIDQILIENVSEFENWGPLYPDDHADEKKRGRPVPERRGQLFRHFVSGLKILGYKVDWKRMNAAYFGAATSRERLFLQATRTRRKIVWPEPSHSPASDLFGEAKPFRAARDIIDFSMPGESIYGRKKPLSENTMRRIYAGLRKFSGLPFVIGQQSCSAPRGIDDPIPTISTAGAISYVNPFLVVLRNNCDASSLDAPVPTICAGGTHVALAEPFLVKYHGSHAGRSDGDGRVHSLDEPLKTLDTQPRFGLAQPYLVSFKGTDSAKDLEVPLGTITGHDRFALCEPLLLEPFIVPNFGEANGQEPRTHELDAPLPTVTSRGAGNLVQPFIVPVTHGGGENRAYSLSNPLVTVTGAHNGELAFVEPFLVEYYGNGDAASLNDPLHTVTTKDRFALVDPQFIEAAEVDKGDVVAVLDIRFRMLQPHELSAAMGFPVGYKFAGNRGEQIKQIGNAVEVNVGKALIVSMIESPKTKKRAKAVAG